MLLFVVSGKQMQYKIEDLVEFNPALIYGFEPESSHKRLGGSEALIDVLVPEAGQHQDMLEAYLFAQSTILPFIRAHGFTAVDEKLLLEWIKTLHAFIGKTLMEEGVNKSGEYALEPVMRWHNGFAISFEFIKFISGKHECKTKEKLASYLEQYFELDIKDGIAFINLLLKLQEDKTIQLGEIELKTLETLKKSPYLSGLKTMHTLYAAVNKKLLSTEDKIVSDKVVKICIYPSEIPAAMQHFAQTTLKKYRACDKSDLKQLSQFLAETFYQFADIHPFGNGNGRVATCFINILIRSFELPSILLRHPGDLKNKGSLYSIAIEKIDHTLVPLQELIMKRIIDAQKELFSDKILEKIISLRVALSELIKRIHNKYPTCDVDSFKDEIDLMPSLFLSSHNEIIIYQLSALITIAAQHEKNLDEACKKPAVIFALQSKLGKKEIDQFFLAMETLSGKKGWKINQAKGLSTWIELPTLEEATPLKKMLQESDLMKVSLNKIKGRENYAITCREINYTQLITLFTPSEEPMFSITI